MDYITRHYKTLSENLQRKLNLLEAMVAQATPPAGTSPTGPMGPPSPAPSTPTPTPGTPPSSTPGPTTPFPPPPNPGMYPRGRQDPAYFQDYYKWLQEFNRLPADHPARREPMPPPPQHRWKEGPRRGGGTYR